jgi:putative ABC transport system permease protein
MNSTLWIALRNVTRNRRRSLLTIIAVIIGIFVVIVIRGNLDGLQKSLKRQITEAETGDVQIHRTGYLQSLEMIPLTLSIKLDDTLKGFIRENTRVKNLSGRILFAGMISDETRENSTTFFARAIDVSHELSVCPRLKENISEGRLPTDTGYEIVVSQQLATSMKLKPGSSVTLAASSKEGAFNALDFTVVGITDVKLPTVYVPLKAAQELLLMPSEVTEIVLDIDDMGQSEIAAKEIGVSLKAHGIDTEVSPWNDVASFFSTIFIVQNAVFGMIGVIVFILVVTGIANAMLMTVFERTREIGTLMAMGMRRRQIVLLFLYEAAIMSGVGGVMGALCGVLVIAIIGINGISFTIPGSFSAATVYPSLSMATIVFTFLGTLIGALVSGCYPAWKASTLKPAEAIRSL